MWDRPDVRFSLPLLSTAPAVLCPQLLEAFLGLPVGTGHPSGISAGFADLREDPAS